MQPGTEITLTVREGLEHDDPDIRDAVSAAVRHGIQVTVVEATRLYTEQIREQPITVTKPFLN